MDKVFQDMLRIEPEQIQEGDYYFKIPEIPGFDNSYTIEQEVISNGIDPQVFLEKRKNRFKKDLKARYESCNIHSPYDEKSDWRFQRFLQGNQVNQKIINVFREIAEKEIPFMDLGSYHMGMAPYILHLNPNVPCLITNRDKHYVSVFRSIFEENFKKHNISIAYCDELSIPLQRQSIGVVTGVLPLSGQLQNRIVDSRFMSLDEIRKWGIVNALLEVNRVLKPGGYFIFSEFDSSWNFSWTDLDNYFKTHDKMYGLFSKDEFYDSLREHKNREKYGLNDEMINMAGFDIEVKETNSFKCDLNRMYYYFCKDEVPDLPRELTKEDDIIDLNYIESIYVLRKKGNI